MLSLIGFLVDFWMLSPDIAFKILFELKFHLELIFQKSFSYVKQSTPESGTSVRQDLLDMDPDKYFTFDK